MDISIQQGTLRIDCLRADIFRVRFSQQGGFTEPALNRYGVLHEPDAEVTCDTREDEQAVVLTTSCATLTADKKTGRVSLAGKDGGTLLQNTADPQSTSEGFDLSFGLEQGEKLYGMGDVTRDRLNKHGFMKKIWVVNVGCYVPIPFLMSDKGWGLLINTTWRHYIDAGCKQEENLHIWSDGGTLDYYLFAGSSLGEILDAYTEISGKPVMLPAWAYGLTFVCNQQANAREMMDDGLNFRREGIPCDVLGLEPGWMENYYDASIQKDWHHDRFYIPPWDGQGQYTFLSAAKRMGFKTSLWLCCDYDFSYYEEEQLGNRIQSSDEVPERYADDFEQDQTFGHAGIRMDKITDPNQPWFEHLKKFVDQGVSAFKLDGAYQINAHPDRLYGNGMTDVEMHNMYPTLYNKQMSQGFSEHTGKRAMVYSSGGYTGIQQYSATWAGDTGGGAKPLVSMLNHGMSGHTNTSCDMDIITPEGIHFGFFQSWSQVCSWAYWRHPWLLDKKTKQVFRDYTKLRYRLFPYIYSTAHIASATAMPIMRAMPLAFPEYDGADQCLNQYMFGENFLVGAFTNEIYLPEGIWYDYWTGEKTTGGQTMQANYPADKGGPLYVKAGAIIPLCEEMDFIGEKPMDSITLQIFDGPQGAFTLYEDDGETYRYQNGEYATTDISFTSENGSLALSLKTEGSYEGMPKCKSYTVLFHTESAPKQVTVNGEDCAFEHCAQGITFHFTQSIA